MPYKIIAANLKKTELACRLHYHQMSYGRKMSSSHALDQEPGGEKQDLSSPEARGIGDTPRQGPAATTTTTPCVNGGSSVPALPRASVALNSSATHVDEHHQSVAARRLSMSKTQHQQHHQGARKSDNMQGRNPKPSISMAETSRWLPYSSQPHEGAPKNKKPRMPPPPLMTISKRDPGNGSGWGNQAISPSGAMLTPLYSPRPIPTIQRRRASVLDFGDFSDTEYSPKHRNPSNHVDSPNAPRFAAHSRVCDNHVPGSGHDGNNLDMALSVNVYNDKRGSFWCPTTRGDYHHRGLQANQVSGGKAPSHSPSSIQRSEATCMKRKYSATAEEKPQNLHLYHLGKGDLRERRTKNVATSPYERTKFPRMSTCGTDDRRNTWFWASGTSPRGCNGSMSQYTPQQQHLQRKGSRIIPPLGTIIETTLPSPCTTERHSSFLGKGKTKEETSSSLTSPTAASISTASLSTNISPTSSNPLPTPATSTASLSSPPDNGRIGGTDADAGYRTNPRRCTVSSLLNYEIQKTPQIDEDQKTQTTTEAWKKLSMS